MPTAEDVTFMRAVADAVDAVVIKQASPGRWRPGTGADPQEWSTLRTFVDGESDPYHLGLAIDKHDQRAMMAAQPTVLAASVAAIRAVANALPDVPAGVADATRALCVLYNLTMSLKVDDRQITPTTATI